MLLTRMTLVQPALPNGKCLPHKHLLLIRKTRNNGMFPIIPYNLCQSSRSATSTETYSSSSSSKVIASCDIPRDTFSEPIDPRLLCGKTEQFDGQLEVEINEKNLLSLKSDNFFGNMHWLRAIRFSDDCHSYNARLCLQKSQNVSQSFNLVIEITRSIRTGHELLLWFSEDILANLQMAFLTPANIQGQKKYVCHICCSTFEYPNPLKLHLTLNCNRQQISSLWDQLVKSLSSNITSSSSTSKSAFGFHLREEENTVVSKEIYSIINLSKSTDILKISNEKGYVKTNTINLPLPKSPSLSPTIEIQRPFSEPATLHSSAFKPYTLTKKSSQNNNNNIRLSQSVSNFTNLTQNFTQNYQPQLMSTIISNNRQNTADYCHAAQMETLVSNLGKSKQGHLCIYCGKCYSRKYGLKIHIRTHTGYKPLKCKYCLRPFGDPSNLNKHVRLHAEGDTPYKCELCGKVLVRRRDLERHLKSRHVENTQLGGHIKEQATSSSDHSD